MNTVHKHPAKILLFGEHTILRGSRALALPLWTHTSVWEWGNNEATDPKLAAFADYLDHELPSCFRTQAFRDDVAAGLFLSSQIPVGYGLGSSGAVCVAVFTRYATAAGQQQLVSMTAKAFFAKMESYFHGASSGTDPLICYLEQAVQLFPDGSYQPVQIPRLAEDLQFFLLDTRQTRQTAPLVAYFLARYDADAAFRAQVEVHWSAATNAAIDALLAGDEPALLHNFRQISQFQWAQLPPMVLPAIRSIWEKGLASNDYLLKICGAGGGGYCLGITRHWAQTQAQLAEWDLIALELI